MLSKTGYTKGAKLFSDLLTHWSLIAISNFFKTTHSNSFYFKKTLLILIKTSLTFVTMGLINNKSSLFWTKNNRLTNADPVLICTHIWGPQWIIDADYFLPRKSQNHHKTFLALSTLPCGIMTSGNGRHHRGEQTIWLWYVCVVYVSECVTHDISYELGH